MLRGESADESTRCFYRATQACKIAGFELSLPMTTPFKIVSPYAPAGDQPKAIKQLVDGVNMGLAGQTLLGLSLIHI